MQVLVIGYGSIGKRHVSNLLKFNEITKIFIFTGIKEVMPIDGKIQLVDSSLYSLDNVLEHERFDFAIIANATCEHIGTAITLAKKGIHLFIEKPLSHNLDRIDALKRIAQKNKLKILIAYNLRFLGAIRTIKELLLQKRIGDIYFAQIEVGQYLPSWRPTSDYRKSYSASNTRGGGVALDLSHEVDYMRYLFGDPAHWKVLRTKASKLEIEAEDIFEGIYKYDSGFICNVHMDYLQTIPRRTIRIVGSVGSLIGDLLKKNIRIDINGEEEILIDDENLFDTGKTFMDEVRHFIETIEKQGKSEITLDDGIKALRLLEDRND